MDPLVSMITLVTNGNHVLIEKIIKQLNKLVNVIKVTDLTATDCVEREMLLAKVNASRENRAEILGLVDIFRGKVVDVSPGHYTVEVTGADDKLQALVNLLKPMGIKGIARTGPVALSRNRK
jgi:acetolactate synthase-1/3 small subunit